jgi:predicted phosphodiesterase
MRVAVLSDIHANLHALEAVWRDLEAQRPEAIYCLGDLVGYGAFPNEVVGFLRQSEIPTVLGNYDEGVGFDLHECGCAYRTAAERARGEASLQWSRAHTSPDHKAYLRSLVPNIRMGESRPTLLLVHGSPRKINEYVYEDRPAATFERLAALAGTDVLLFGHTHLPYVKRVGRTLFVNAGSVGKPRGGDPRAVYALVDLGRVPTVEFRRVAYDAPAAAEAVRAAGLPAALAELLLSGGVEPAEEGAKA